MARCPTCQESFPAGKRFCRRCGTELLPEQLRSEQPPRCRSCGAVVSPGKKFCRSCGASIAAAATATEPELICSVCGKKGKPGKQFCAHCGANLTSEKQAPRADLKPQASPDRVPAEPSPSAVPVTAPVQATSVEMAETFGTPSQPVPLAAVSYPYPQAISEIPKPNPAFSQTLDAPERKLELQKRARVFGIAVAVVVLLVGFAWWFSKGLSRQFNQALTKGKPTGIEGKSAYEPNLRASKDQTALVPSDVMAVMEQWRQSMLSGDVDAQTNCYAPTVELFFRRKNLDREILRKMKRSGMKAYPDVRAYRLTDVELQSLTESRAVVTFRKYWDGYGTKHFSGEEKQRLTFLKIEGEWKIVREEELQIYWVKKE